MPPRTVAETACIKGARATDILAVVKTVGIPRTNKNNKTITDVTLIDDSTASNGKLATVVINVWGQQKVEALQRNEGQAMVFFNLSATYRNGLLSIDHYEDNECFRAPECEKTVALREKAASLKTAADTCQLTSA